MHYLRREITAITVLLGSLLLLGSCARVGQPSGGPKDLTPPVIIRANPPFQSLNFKENTITLYFDEYVKIKDLHKYLLVSPPLKYPPEISPLGTASKFIRIKIKDTLKENTTYSIRFGDAIRDYTENNVIKDFMYVFSTGDNLDTLKLTGRISPSLYPVKNEEVIAMLYKVDSLYNDSVILRKKPDYMARVSPQGDFVFQYLSAGTYKLIALRDIQPNYKYDPAVEPLGFTDSYIKVPTDTTFAMSLFYSPPEKGISLVKTLSPNHILLAYTGLTSPEITSVKDLSGEKEYIYYKEEDKDTLHIWVRKSIKDSVFLSAKWKDTVMQKKLKFLPISSLRDSLMIKSRQTSFPVSTDTLHLIANMPVETVNERACLLMDKDSQFVPVHANVMNKHVIGLSFKNQKSGRYRLMLNPGAVEAFTGQKNDSLSLLFISKEIKEFGSLELEIKAEKSGYGILQLLSKNKDKIVREKYISLPEEVNFKLLPPGEYNLRLLWDDNGNKHWDTGDYFLHRQPEPVYYYPQTITIKPNWTIRQQIIFQ